MWKKKSTRGRQVECGVKMCYKPSQSSGQTRIFKQWQQKMGSKARYEEIAGRKEEGEKEISGQVPLESH